MKNSWNAVTRDDLLTWANSDGAASTFPELVRQLVLETGSGIETIDFPGGSGVTTGGFDGFVRATNGTPFVPVGPSVWELSVRKDAPKKADEDYAKRSEVPDGSPASESTYIQAICRPWTSASSWARDRTADQRWLRVDGYNVDRLATWLEQAPATRVRFLEQIHRPTAGVRSGAEWWRQWSNDTDPPLTPDVVLARKFDDLKLALGRPGITTVAGPLGVDEVIACVVAAGMANEDVEARTVVVHDRSVWPRLLQERSPLVLVATDPSWASDVSPETPHTVIIPVPQHDDGDVVLEAVDGDRVADSLRALEASLPNDLGALARRSFVALRRRLARRPELMTPSWAQGPIPRAARAALLLTSWDDRNESDRKVVEALSGTTYEAAREQLQAYTHGEDAFLALTDHGWHLVSPLDAWLLLGRHLLTDDLQQFVTQAGLVLSERDPSFDLPRDERWRASFDGKVLAHSSSLRKGVATGLALLGKCGDKVVSATSVTGEQWAGRVVRPLLEAANADRSGELWASVAGLLPLLMESAPRDVLDGLRAGTQGDRPALANIFQDDSTDSFLFGPSSPHSWFLWALETAAWSTEHVGQAAELLAALASIDPGGRLSNRPATSLANVFSSWHPHTTADPTQRLVIIDRLRKRWTDVAWDLMISLLPTSHGVHFPTSEPRYRTWRPRKAPVLVSEYWQYVEDALDRLIADVGDNGRRWSDLLEAFPNLPVELRSKVRDVLAGLNPDELSEDTRRLLWDKARKTVAHHREYADTQWALPPDELDGIETVVARLAPGDAEDRHAWLFAEHWIEIGELGLRADHRAHEEEVERRRTSAMKEIADSGGLDAVAATAVRGQPSIVGGALANAFEDTYLDVMYSWVDEDEPRSTVGKAYLWQRSRAAGLGWVESQLDTRTDLSDAMKARLLLGVDDFRTSWEEAKRRGQAVEDEYWRGFNHFGRGQDFSHAAVVAEHLMGVGRNAAALDALSLYGRGRIVAAEYANTVATVFEHFIEADCEDPDIHLLRQWDYQQLFALLDQHVESIGLDRVTTIQWYFFQVLGFDPPTTTLHRRLSAEPKFFVEILSLIYRAKNEVAPTEDESPDERRQGLAKNAYALLDSWSVSPGVDLDGNFDLEACRTWIDQALVLLESADRLDIGMQYVGHILTYTPADEHGWPSNEVADLIEELGAKDIDRGIAIKLHNRRGVTSRGVTEGGEQERTLAKDYRERADRFRNSHLHVARILNDLADDYEAEARRNDAEAERRRRGLD